MYDERAVIIRPGLIVGPHDPTDRFTYWPVRVARGGDVLAPQSRRRPSKSSTCAICRISYCS
jgi:2'-hydroxyisoflavone reductase